MKPEIEKTDEIERRTHTVEMRVKDSTVGNKTPTMEGYAANFNSISEDLGGFREMLANGCFAEALKTSDVRALFNHNADKILGRNTAGTLRLFEDEHGLKFEINPDMEISYVKDLTRSMSRGDITNCSFGFSISEGGDVWRKEPDGMWLRTIVKVDRLYDVSPVTYPAYVSTSCAVRSMLQKQNELETSKDKETYHFETHRRRLELELML